MLFSKEKREAKRRKDELVRRNPQLMAGQDTYTFRRSRTLTGTTSSTIRGTNEAASQLKSPRLKTHELHHHRRKVLVALVVTLAMAGATYWLLWQYTANITAIIYNPPLLRAPDNKAYIEAVQGYLSSRPFERFRFALDEQSLQTAVQEKHPEVASVNGVVGTGFGDSSISVTLRQPVVGWKVGSEQYYVDGSGVSFRKNYFASPQVTVRDLSGVSPSSSGGAIASNRFLSFLGRVVTLTSEMNVGKVTTVTIPAGLWTRTVEISLQGRAYPIRMHIDRDPAEQVEDAKRAIRYLVSKGTTPRYIDVRVSGKAFYR